MADDDRAATGEERSVPGEAGREDAVEEIDAGADEVHEVGRSSGTHEVPRLLPREMGRRRGGDPLRLRSRLSHGQAAQRVAVEPEPHHRARALDSKVEVRSPLHDAEDGLVSA